MLNTLAAEIIFYFVAAITVGFAALVAFSRNIVYSAFALVGALMGVAGFIFCSLPISSRWSRCCSTSAASWC